MFSIFNLKKAKYLYIFLLITLFILGIFFLTQSTQAKPSSKTSNEGVFNPKIDWFYLRTSNDITVYMGKMFSKLPTIRYEKGNDHLQFSMTGISHSSSVPNSYNLTPISSTTAVTLETNVKTPNEPVLFYRGVDKDIDVIYKISNIPLKVKEEIVLKQSKISNLKSKNLSFLFSAETTAKPVKQSDGSIAFFDNKGDYLFQLDKPFMIDANLNRSEAVSLEIKPVRHRVSNIFKSLFNLQLYTFSPQSILNNFIIKKFFPSNPSVSSPDKGRLGGVVSSLFNLQPTTYNLTPKNYTLTLSADSAWLSTATYPVIIDPTITHNEDAEFDGQKNRIADSDTTSSTQLESSYGENVNDPYTVLNLHFNEANGTQTGIRDYASTTRVITANGHASTTNYVTQLGMGNSAAFDGIEDYFSLPDSDDFSFGNGDFSLDIWFRRAGVTPNNHQHIFSKSSGSDYQLTLWYRETDDTLSFLVNTQYIHEAIAKKLEIGTWYHIATVRSGNDWLLYLNGELISKVNSSISISDTTSTFLIGRGGSTWSTQHVNGYLDSLRILKGRALTPEEIKASASRRPYAVYTSSVLDASASVQWDTLNWTEGGVGTGDGETLYNSSSLVAQWNFNETSGTTADNAEGTAALDGTLNGFSYTASQDQATTTTGWTANNKKWGAGSLMFDGVNDYVTTSDSDNYDFGTGNFSIEAWVKEITINTSRIIGAGSLADGAENSWGFGYGYNSGWGNGMRLNFAVCGVGCASYTSNQVASSTDWSHVVVSRSNNVMTFYVNGMNVGTSSITSNVNGGTSGATIGARYNTNTSNVIEYNNAIIDSVRIYKGRALSQAEILSNYNAGNIEIQTRTGATSDPNDGTWEAWKPTTGETQLLSMDSDKLNWDYQNQSDAYTKLLLHMDGTDASTIFVNSATTTHTITRNGDAQVDTAQSKFGGSSVLFDGTGDYLSLADSSDFDLGLSGEPFTVEVFINSNDSTFSILDRGGGGAWNGTDGHSYILDQQGSTVYWQWWTGTSGVNIPISDNLGTGSWIHVAVTYDGTTTRVFKNGVIIGSGTGGYAKPSASNMTTVGRYVFDSNYLAGHLDELRISKGIARWTSNFTPPTGQYRPYYPRIPVQLSEEGTIKQEGTASTKLTLGAPQVDGNTVALWHFEETGTTTGTYLYDETANNNDATTTGTTVVDGIFGKARKFNGTSDYVSALDSENWNFGNGDFSIDAWVKWNSFTPVDQSIVSQWIAGCNGMNFGFNSTNGLAWDVSCNYAVAETGAGGNWSPGVWYHVAIVRNGNNHILYRNGQAILSQSYANTITNYAQSLTIGRQLNSSNYFNGIIDEPRILKGRALSADEIAETYRMGANHHLTRQVSAVDLSSANKLAFNIAGDRPGTYLDAMLGESDYANYELASSTLALSTTTVLYIKGDEIASSASIKDSSFSGKAITANGNARTSGNGKIGNSLYFSGASDKLTTGDTSTFKWMHGAENTTGFKWSIDFWYKANNFPGGATGSHIFFGSSPAYNGNLAGVSFMLNERDFSGRKFCLSIGNGTTGFTNSCGNIGSYPNDTTNFHHIALTYDQSLVSQNSKIYLDGTLIGSADKTADAPTTSNSNQALMIGPGSDTNYSWVTSGYLDEFRIIKDQVLTPDQIRQAYEYGLRAHQITIDFGATLQTSDLISNSTDYNFNITATTSGLSATTSGLYLGDKIIIKENLGGTEYTAQGTVKAINTTTGAITVSSWDNGSTFPASNGYSPNATVFKWQREYFDLTGAATTTRNAITNLTLRPTNNAGGRTIYLDDFRYNTNYLTASSSSAITSSNNRYLQYRAIFTSTDSFVSPFLSAFNTLYTSLADMFPAGVGISGDGFLIF